MKRMFVIMHIIIIVCASGGCIRQKPTETPIENVYYREGYIYTIDGQPIQGLSIYHADFSDSYKKIGGITNEHGYFKFQLPVEWSMTMYMYIRSEGKTIDSIVTRKKHIARQRVKNREYNDDQRHVFEIRRADTFFVDMECKGRSFEVLQGQKRPERRYYEGYIYTIEGQPIRNLNVYSLRLESLNERYKFRKVDLEGGITNEHGYFKFDQAYYWKARYLFIGSEGRIIDSIDRGFKCCLPSSTFDDKTSDTFFVDMEGKGRSFRVLQGQTRIPNY
jgi:hypothetical protein